MRGHRGVSGLQVAALGPLYEHPRACPDPGAQGLVLASE